VKPQKDFFSRGVIIYAVCLFLLSKTLFQLSYVHALSNLWYWSVGLIVINVIGLIWCLGVCLLGLMPRQFLSFICAASLVVALEFLSPDPIKVHFLLHKSEYASRVSASLPAADGRLSLVLYAHGDYISSMPGGHLCVTEILYDNSGNPDLISRSEDGRASLQKIDDNFYLRYPPCG
jgi:hypothetical protein